MITMNTPSLQLTMILTIILLWSCNCTYMYSQEIQQITNGESQRYDANYEEPINFDGIGHYTSFKDDKVMVYKMDSQEKVYETSFDLCEEGVVEWYFSGKDIFYLSYKGIIAENIENEGQERYLYEDLQDAYLYNSLSATLNLDVITIRFFPGAVALNFDVANRRFLDDILINHVFTTEKYFYHTTGFFGDSQFIRFNRNTYESDTLLSGYTPEGHVRSSDKYYLLTKEWPLQVIDKNDEVKTYDFEHNRISSGVETSTGKLLLAEGFSEGSIIYTLDIETSSLINIDTIELDGYIELLDTYEDRIYLEYNTQTKKDYGYMDHPYTDIDILTEDLEIFNYYPTNNAAYHVLISSDGSSATSKINLIEKSTATRVSFEFQTLSLWLDDRLEIINTSEGLRYIVSEQTGKSIYEYDADSDSVLLINNIENKRGLGTSIQKNGDSYLIVSEHSFQSAFEYIHPETNALVSHEAEGIIYGDVIPFEGKYYYIRNKDHQGHNEDYFMDIVMFDPETNTVDLLEEDYFVPQNSNYFGNIVGIYMNFGFASVSNTSLQFDLKTNKKINPEPEITELIDRIYFASDNYFYSYTGSGSQNEIHVRVDRDDYTNQQIIYEGDYRKILKHDDDSFVAIYPNLAYYVEEDKVTTIAAPDNFLSTFADIIDSKLFLRGFTENNTFLVIFDLTNGDIIDAAVEGIAIDIIGDYVISVSDVSPPYEIISNHIGTGNRYAIDSVEPYSRIFKTDTSLYVFNRDLKTIDVFNPQWEKLEEFAIDLPDNSSLTLISPPNTLPLLFKTQVIKSSSANRNNLDYDLLFLDPRTKELETYFDCGSDLRFNKEFEIGAKSTMLLRTADAGYQIHEVMFPGFDPVSIEELDVEYIDVPSIGPNPTDNYVTIDAEYENAILHNSLGQYLEVYKNDKKISLENYQCGIYYLKIKFNPGLRHTYKIIKH